MKKKFFAIILFITMLLSNISLCYATETTTTFDSESTSVYTTTNTPENFAPNIQALPIEPTSQDISLDLILSLMPKETYIILIIAVIGTVALLLISRKNKRNKTSDKLRKEVLGYVQAAENRPYSGRISVISNGIVYSRGNRSVTFNIPIQKTTILAPFMIEAWFENRNYNEKESDDILYDISRFLTENRISKAKIISDEEYDELINEN